MEVVLLDDMIATFNTTWARIANTTGADQIKVGDEFQEVGALEQFQVEAVSPSPVPGASRLRLLRAHHSTRPEVHKAGAVLRSTSTRSEPMAVQASTATNHTDLLANGSASAVDNLNEGTTDPLATKRGRGRPPGAKNKPKAPMQVPAWPGVR